ncbi:hypothetical protein EJ08DRAFT_686770 [Tothia fuscella]|uniref:Uncharacterized protein n=1 Tax=Tothia fuscella TaxID=1048955 RepID=A0A9P4TZH8_9PEZI|nr:hypothetical protein EJ08DRAFT_686770 [Tothia fuscella]
MVEETDRECSKHLVITFDGAIYTTNLNLPNRAFSAEVTFYLQHHQLLKLEAQKPPLHFHPYQEEYIEVTQGRLAVEVDGKERILSLKDGVLAVKPWSRHRLYPPPNHGSQVTKFILSGAMTEEQYRLDKLFFSNWYAYQDRIFIHGAKISLIQVMSMFDAAGSYLSLPQWILWGYTLSHVLGILTARWVGGLLGYQPYYRDWSSDWNLVCS